LKIALDASVLIASVKRVGEKYHREALTLARRILAGDHECISSALVLIELPGALGSTTMPLEKVYETETSLLKGFNVTVRPFDPFVDRAMDLILEFRDLKRKYGIGSADFHYLATASAEGCDSFISTDEKHMLRSECRESFSKYISVQSPAQAIERL
jgi:predicted nucleic acid-binding protein